jgi:diguanylate cyclase (GGDEF)-like protein/PAS domain S-box-containing protein
VVASSELGKRLSQPAGRQRTPDALEAALRESDERFESLMRLSTIFFWETDPQHRLTLLIRGSTQTCPPPDEGQIGKTRWEIPSTKPDETGWQAHREVLERHLPFSDFEFSRIVREGNEHHYSISGEPRFASIDRFVGYRGVGHDITEQRFADYELRRFRAAVDATADGIHIVDRETMCLIDVNEAACRNLGYTREEFLHLDIKDFAPGADQTNLPMIYDRLFSGEDAEQSIEIVHRRKNGTEIPIEIHRRGVVINGHRIVVNVVRDITRRKTIEIALRESEERFRGLIELISDWYWEQDEHYRFTFISGDPTGRRLSLDQFYGKTFWECGDIEASEEQWLALRTDLVARRPYYEFVYWGTASDGTRSRYFSVSGRPVFNAAGDFKGYRGAGRDITERMISQERVHYLAYHDGLTGLKNRTYFLNTLARSVQQARRSGSKLGLVFIDLDGFKRINDTFGHDVGDQLLVAVAGRLRQSLRQGDLIARLGGDEFVVMVEGVNALEPFNVVATKVLAELAKPYEIGERALLVTASIGISVFPDDAADEHTLMKSADTAMYGAKEEGKNQVRFFSGEGRTTSSQVVKE